MCSRARALATPLTGMPVVTRRVVPFKVGLLRDMSRLAARVQPQVLCRLLYPALSAREMYQCLGASQEELKNKQKELK